MRTREKTNPGKRIKTNGRHDGKGALIRGYLNKALKEVREQATWISVGKVFHAGGTASVEVLGQQHGVLGGSEEVSRAGVG